MADCTSALPTKGELVGLLHVFDNYEMLDNYCYDVGGFGSTVMTPYTGSGCSLSREVREKDPIPELRRCPIRFRLFSKVWLIHEDRGMICRDASCECCHGDSYCSDACCDCCYDHDDTSIVGCILLNGLSAATSLKFVAET